MSVISNDICMGFEFFILLHEHGKGSLFILVFVRRLAVVTFEGDLDIMWVRKGFFSIQDVSILSVLVAALLVVGLLYKKLLHLPVGSIIPA